MHHDTTKTCGQGKIEKYILKANIGEINFN
jgi:hypothetical protein